MKISNKLLETLTTAGNILDNAPIAEGERYIYDPANDKMLKIFISGQKVRIVSEVEMET